jgi:hypothetical protein
MSADSQPSPFWWLLDAPSTAEYEAFVRSLQVVSVRFARASVQAPAIYIANPARRLILSTTKGAKYLNFANGFAATLEFHFRGCWEDEPSTGVTAEAEVEILYGSQSAMTDPMFQLFRDRLLTGHAWPYLREFLHSSIGRTGWPVHTLPFFPGPAGAPNPAPPAAGSGGLAW